MEKLARSKAGHDKGHLYAVVKEDGDFIYLADGRTKTLDHPKRKNIKHVQPVTHLPDEISALLGSAAADSDLVHVLRLYEQKEK